MQSPLRFFLFLLFFSTAQLCIAQLPDLIPYRKGNLWGYCDSNKVVKIEPKYAYANWFDKDGVAEVEYYCANKYEDSGICTKYINKQGIELSQTCRLLDSNFCLLTNKKENILTLISTNTKEEILKDELLYNGYSYSKYHIYFRRVLVFKKGKRVFVYIPNKKPISFIDKKIKSIDEIHDKNTIIYTFRGKDSALKILNKFNQELYFLCTDINGERYIRYLNGKKTKIKDSALKVKRIYRETFFFNLPQKKIAYSITGKKLFSINTKNRIDHYGKSQFIEYYKADTGYYYNIINKKGKYLIKGLWFGKYLPYNGFSSEIKPTYYKDKDSCYTIQNINGEIFKLCEKGELYCLNKSFVVFITKDTLLKVYNSKGKFLGEGFRENRRFVIYQWEDENYFVCADEEKPIMLNKEGKIIVLPEHYYLSSIFPLNDKYFFSYYWDNVGVTILIFDDKGHVLYQYNSISIREEEIHFFWESPFQQYNLKYPSALLYPLMDACEVRDRKEGVSLEKPKLLSITPDGIKEIMLSFKNISYIELISEYNDFDYFEGTHEIITSFNKVIFSGWGAYENSFYVDIYGTIYYDD